MTDSLIVEAQKEVEDSEEDKGLVIVGRSATKAPSCRWALTVWVCNRDRIEFAITQLDKYGAPWLLKRNAQGEYAVFVPREKDLEVYQPKRRNE